MLRLNPATNPFASENLTVSVGTNNQTGYKLYVSTTNDTTNLVEENDSNLYIETLSSEVSESNFTANRWGYKLNSSSTNYAPFVSGTLVNSSDTATAGVSSTLTFGAKADYNTKAGIYNLALNFQATANPLYTTIADATYMQEVSPKAGNGCPNTLTTGQSYPLKDSRDERTYYVARLADGNCWMVQNLRLGQDTTSIALTNEKSDVSSSGFTLNGKSSNGSFTYTTVNGTNYQNNSSQYYCTNNYGCYYNWYTATAGSGTTYIATDGQSVEYSICPAGWSLPTSTEWAALKTAYNNSAAAMLVNPTSLTENTNGASAPGLLLGGLYGYNATYRIGTRGDHWTSTTYSARDACTLIIDINSVSIGSTNFNKYYGAAVRCILK